MPFSFFARDEMYVLLESFQLSCIRDCDERNQRHVKLLESGFDLFIFFSLRDHFISGCFPFYVSREGFFFFFCMRFKFTLFSSAISIRAVISPTAIPFPFVHVLNHGWMHLFFLWKRFFFLVCLLLLLLDKARFHAVISGTILIQFELRREKVCLLFLQRRIPFDCQLCEIRTDAHEHNLVSAQADR